METYRLEDGNLEMRMSRTEYYMTIAGVVAQRSTCTRTSVGAVLVDPSTNRIVATGYNGSAKGSPHCIDVGCLMHEGHCVRTIHAELNAVLHLEHNYPELTLYCTHMPCLQCIKALVGANVRHIYFQKYYEDEARNMLLPELKVFIYPVNLTR